jgi:hypothetical protein
MPAHHARMSSRLIIAAIDQLNGLWTATLDGRKLAHGLTKSNDPAPKSKGF